MLPAEGGMLQEIADRFQVVSPNSSEFLGQSAAAAAGSSGWSIKKAAVGGMEKVEDGWMYRWRLRRNLKLIDRKIQGQTQGGSFWRFYRRSTSLIRVNRT